MAVIKFTNSKSSVKKILDYITQPSKTEERLISGKDCMPETALQEMLLVKNMYGKAIGRQYIHIVQSFDPKDELTHEKANEIGIQLAERFVGFQAVIATHKDRMHIHNHILLNSVNFETALKFQQSKKDMQDLKDFSDRLCLENGLSVIENPNKGTDIKQNEYQAALKRKSWKMTLILTIDKAILESKNRQDFISVMNRFGYDVSWTDTRKYITYTTPDGKKCRDNKLHDEKYLKEQMEDGFREIEGNSEEQGRNTNFDKTAGFERTDSSDFKPTKADRETSSNDTVIPKKSIKQQLADYKNAQSDRKSERELQKANSYDRD